MRKVISERPYIESTGDGKTAEMLISEGDRKAIVRIDIASIPAILSCTTPNGQPVIWHRELPKTTIGAHDRENRYRYVLSHVIIGKHGRYFQKNGDIYDFRKENLTQSRFSQTQKEFVQTFAREKRKLLNAEWAELFGIAIPTVIMWKSRFRKEIEAARMRYLSTR